MDHDPWYEINHQRERVIDSPPADLAELRQGILPRGDWERWFEESNSAKSDEMPPRPMSYYTKACAWASDYVFLNRRVMVRIAPNSEYRFEEYIQREFGCPYETFVKLVENGDIAVLLHQREQYTDKMEDGVKRLFDTVTQDVDGIYPRYINMVDDALGAMVARDAGATEYEHSRLDSVDTSYVDIDETIQTRMRSAPWTEIDREEVEFWGVSHDDLRKYLTERATKLDIAGEAIGSELGESDLSPGSVGTAIQNSIEYDGNEKMFQRTYKNWNLVGTPMYYCDFTGVTDIGKSVYLRDLRQTIQRVKQYLLEKAGTTSSRLRLSLTKDNVADRLFIPDFTGTDTDRVFGVAPTENTEQALEKRIEAYPDYYEEFKHVRESWSQPATRRELRKTYNERMERRRNINESAMSTATILKFAAEVTGVYMIGGALPAGATAGVEILKELSNMVFSETEIEANSIVIPEPSDADRLELGHLSRWEIPYGRLTDGGSHELTYVEDVERID